MARRDKIAGCIIGLAVGDALGCPHEFASQRDNVYTGVLYIEALYKFRFVSWKNVVGQFSDDTEMSLALIRSIIENGGIYSRDKAIIAYMNWANTSRGMGANTRELFKGIKTIRGYTARWNKKFGDLATSNTWTQSNGSLMRCAVLGFLGVDVVVMNDCLLTNPHPINVECSRIYCRAIAVCARGLAKPHIADELFKMNILQPVVRDVLFDAVHGTPRDVTGETKGWVLHAFYCAFTALFRHETYQDAIDAVIRMGGDTDTNAAVAGALVGSYLGYAAMRCEDRTRQNIDIVRALDTTRGTNPRPAEYCLGDFDKLIDDFARSVL